MSKRLDKEQISNKNTKRLKKERSIGEAKTEIVNQIIEQIKEILEDSIEEGDSTGGFKYTLGKYFVNLWVQLVKIRTKSHLLVD